MYYCEETEYVLLWGHGICSIVRVRHMYYCEDMEYVLFRVRHMYYCEDTEYVLL